MIWLIFAHFIGDVALQTFQQGELKRKYWYIMFCHSMVWATCISIALEYLGLFTLPKVIFLVAGHWACDKWKSTKPIGEWKWAYIDQSFHMLQCLIVYFF